MRTEDGSLIQKCLDGESAAFGFLVDKYKSCLYAFAYSKLGNYHDAEDIAQEAFLKAYQKLHTLRGYDKFLAWLYAITDNLCKDFLRSKASRPDGEFVEEIEEEVLERPSMDAYQAGLTYQSLYDALKELPEMYRQVLTLHYLGGMKSREIAEFLGTSKNTIDQRLNRAKSLLKEELLAMMSTTYNEMKLQPSFTFRIVEMIKEMKIQTPPNQTALPWGLSIATGLAVLLTILAVPFSPLYPIGTLIGSALSAKMQVAEKGEIPVDVVDITKTPILSSDKGKKDFGQKPKPKLNAAAPPGQEGKWTRKADMPTPRFYLSASVVNGKIYAIGGWMGGWSGTPIVEAYDPTANTWTRKADMPTARGGLATCVVNGKIYAFGGSGIGGGFLSTVEAYDPATDTWEKKKPMSTGRLGPAAVVVNGKVYVIGGWNSGNRQSSVAVYDPLTDTWEQKANAPAGFVDAGFAEVNGKIYIVGGGWDPPSATTYEYDPATDQWTRKADMPTPRFLLSASVLGDKLYVIGGAVAANAVPKAVVEVYHPATDTWTKGAKLPTARGSLSTAVVKGKMYAIGGQTGIPWIGAGPIGTVYPIVEEYDPGLPQSVTPAGKFPTLWGEVKTED